MNKTRLLVLAGLFLVVSALFSVARANEGSGATGTCDTRAAKTANYDLVCGDYAS